MLDKGKIRNAARQVNEICIQSGPKRFNREAWKLMNLFSDPDFCLLGLAPNFGRLISIPWDAKRSFDSQEHLVNLSWYPANFQFIIGM